MPSVTRISFSSPGAGLVTASSLQTRGFLLLVLIKMRERMVYKLRDCSDPGQCSQHSSPSIDIGSISNSRKDFLEPDLIEDISAESIAKTDLEN